MIVDELMQKMGEYVKMTEELPFPEFLQFHNDLMALLQKDYQELNEEQLIQAKGMTGILAANARSRALRKDDNRKKYHKIAEKAGFWEEAINARLLKSGMKQDDLNARVEALWSEPAAAVTGE